MEEPGEPYNDENERKYQNYIERLSKSKRQYRILSTPSRHNKVSFTRIDFPDANNVQSSKNLIVGPSTNYQTMRDWFVGELDPSSCRLILVEDLSPKVCIALGATLDLNPQYFVDHLNGQVVGSDDDDQKPRQMDWVSNHQKKPYTSVCWFRPVQRLNARENARRHVEQMRESVVMKGEERSAGQLTEQSGLWQMEMACSASHVLRPELNLTINTATKLVPAQLAAIEERVSIYQVERNGCRYVIVLVDPQPQLLEVTWTRARQDSRLLKIPKDARRKAISLYNGLTPRLTSKATFQELSELDDKALRRLYGSSLSTMESLKSKIRSLSSAKSDKSSLFDCLAEIVSTDTLGLLSLLDSLLGSIVDSNVSMNADIEDLRIQRGLILHLQWQLPVLNRSIAKRLAEVSQWTSCPEDHSLFNEVKEAFENTILVAREAATAITGTLQFIESHRAIAEAESVTRLTELAFFFIPLSFATSAFSMQIQDLSQPVPVWIFITFALCLSAFTYVLRVVVRSAWVHKYKAITLGAVRDSSSIASGVSIPNRAFFVWAWRRMAPAAAKVGVIALPFTCLVAILTIVWTRDFDAGLKAALTVLFLILLVLPLLTLASFGPGIPRWFRSLASC